MIFIRYSDRCQQGQQQCASLTLRDTIASLRSVSILSCHRCVFRSYRIAIYIVHVLLRCRIVCYRIDIMLHRIIRYYVCLRRIRSFLWREYARQYETLPRVHRPQFRSQIISRLVIHRQHHGLEQLR